MFQICLPFSVLLFGKLHFCFEIRFGVVNLCLGNKSQKKLMKLESNH